MLKQLDILIGFATVMTIVSLLITVINQMIMSGWQFRGKSLMDALEVMFKTLKPDLGDKAKALAEAVLKHPIISDSAKNKEKRGLASAIRPSELLDVLRNLAAITGTNSAQWIGNTMLKESAKQRKKDSQTVLTIGEVAQGASYLLEGLEHPDKAVSQANQQITDFLTAMPGNPAAAIMPDLKTLELAAKTNVQSTLENTEKWFGMVEDRAREWFATNAQYWNVFIAIVLTLLFQLDALRLYQQLSNDDTYRAKVVAAAGTVAAKAQAETERMDGLTQTIHKEAIKSLTAEKALDSAILDKLAKRPENVQTDQQERDWIAEQLGEASVKEVLEKYRAAFTKAAGPEFDKSKTELAEVVKTANSLDKGVAKGGFQIIPDDYPDTFLEWIGLRSLVADRKTDPKPWGLNLDWLRWGFTDVETVWNLSHLFGMAFFAALLSLGAPYWFNLLKTLTSFRPLLAQEVDKDQKKKDDAKP